MMGYTKKYAEEEQVWYLLHRKTNMHLTATKYE